MSIGNSTTLSAAEAPAISVCVATRDRASLLERMLRSLEVAQAAVPFSTEVVVVDNASVDDTAKLLGEWVARGPGRICCVAQPPNKSRALNEALARASAPLLAFTDDDVEVAPDWLAEIGRFFAEHPEYDGGMGRVRPARNVSDRDVLARAAGAGTLPLCDRGDAVHDLHELYGCNMILRRRVFDVIGGFDERYGPGGTGWGEDTEISERACAAGLRLGYMPGVVVYHTVDPARLTPGFLRQYHRGKARNDFARDPQRVSRKNLRRLVDASLRFAWCTLTGQVDRATRARMRMIRHAELLRVRWLR